MKKWVRFFCHSFFSHKAAKEGTRRGYTNVFLGFVLALAFLWAGFVGAEMLPFGIHYNHSPSFRATVQAVLANVDTSKRIVAKIENGNLKVKKHGGEYDQALFINTFENDVDKQNYSINGCNVVVDSRPADTLAEIEAYCVSNDGKGTVISYQEYLTLSNVAKLNFDFKLKYTGNALELTDEAVTGYREYVDGLSDENKGITAALANDLSQSKITKHEYDRSIYELYFANYYPEITAYESTSKVPLLRNYYQQYVKENAHNYLFIFDDYMMGAFETKGGVDVLFYGFYSNLADGVLITEGAGQKEAEAQACDFIKDAFRANGFLNAYAYFVNIVSLIPYIALMLLVAALLSYSLLRLRGVESIASLGAMFKIVGSFVWISGALSALFAVMAGFFVKRGWITALALVLFFAVLVTRSILFVIQENKIHTEQLKQQEAEQTEV